MGKEDIKGKNEGAERLVQRAPISMLYEIQGHTTKHLLQKKGTINEDYLYYISI